MDKRLGHISAAIGTETTGSIWNLFTGKSTHGQGNNTKRNKEQKSFEERLSRSRGFDHLRLLLHLFEANQMRGNFLWQTLQYWIHKLGRNAIAAPAEETSNPTEHHLNAQHQVLGGLPA